MFDNPVDNTYSAEDAQVVFAALLARADLLLVLREALCAQDFNPRGERPLWLALNALAQQGVEFGPEAVVKQLARHGDFSAAIAALPRLDLFAPVLPSDAALAAAVENLRRRSRERQVVALLTDLIEIGLAKQKDPAQAVAAIQARAAAEGQGLKAAPAAPLSARQLVDDPASASQPLWLVDRLLPAGGVSLLVGEVASGKTFLALDLAIAVAASSPAWGGRDCLGGRVLYCCLDSSPRTMRGRVLALCAGRGIDPPEGLFFDFSALNLAQPADQQRLLSLIRATRATLLVLDVLARYLPGVDENAVASVGPVFSLLRGIAAHSGVSFLVVHHFNKSGGGAGPTARMQRVRGSSDIAAAVDAVLSVTLLAPRGPAGLLEGAGAALAGSQRQPRRTVTPEKNRELPEEPPFDFVIEAGVGGAGPRDARSGGLVLRFSPHTPQLSSVAERSAWARAQVLDMLSARSLGPSDSSGPPGSMGPSGSSGLTRHEIESGLRASLPAGQHLSTFTLNQLFTDLAGMPGVSVVQVGRFKRYRWDGEG